MGEKFFENLKDARISAGLSQKEVAEQLGVAKSSYSLYESGKREPDVDKIKKLAQILGVSSDTLLGLPEHDYTVAAAHFDGSEYTPEQLDRIREFAKFVKQQGE